MICRRINFTVLLVIGGIFSLSCTGPHLWIECHNGTEHYAALSLRRLENDEMFVAVADPHDYSDIDINSSGGFSWIVKLYDRDALVFCDSGQVNLDTEHDLCGIEHQVVDSFTVTWTDR